MGTKRLSYIPSFMFYSTFIKFLSFVDRVVYLRTWGCSHNNSDSEYMAGLLLKAGFKVTSEKELADIWLLNSCKSFEKNF